MVISCSLDRFLQGYRSSDFLDQVWRHFDINYRVIGFLDCHSQYRFSRSCVVVLADRADVALAATEWREGWDLSSWSVPTPPVAAYSAPSSVTDGEL